MLNQGDVCLKPVVGASGELNLTECGSIDVTYPVPQSETLDHCEYYEACHPYHECGWGIVTWDEGAIMVLAYGSYILFMVFNKTIMSKCESSSKYKIHSVDTEKAMAAAVDACRSSIGPGTIHEEVAKSIG